ncbi:acetoacetate decarboxylase family protein [Saccharomonospora sp. NPDC046836]|uniref:acetoacetate decarboxylase family protein n=1 Tax=Saccharomonospora sp. NPDC046836 TaxID=3156921 RepID=UPI0034057FE3
MGFVRTQKEIREIEAALAAPEFVHGEQLLVRFRTSEETYRRLLPPPLEPLDDPLCVAAIGRWQGSCVGDYAGGSVSLSAAHQGDAGGFAVAMWMNTEASVMFGRDVFGEPKKLAESGLARDGERAHAWIDRHGVRLVELMCTVDIEEDPASIDRLAFNYRSRTAANGIGLEGPAVLTRTVFSTTIHERRRGPGSVRFSSTVHDPLGEIPVLEVLDAEYQRHDIRAACTVADEVAAEDFLPYHHGRADDWRALDSRRPLGEGAR